MARILFEIFWPGLSRAYAYAPKTAASNCNSPNHFTQLEEVQVNKENVKLRGDPARIRKQGDIVENAVKKLMKRSKALNNALGPEGTTTLALQNEVHSSIDVGGAVCFNKFIIWVSGTRMRMIIF